jgi:hypothetical protein
MQLLMLATRQRKSAGVLLLIGQWAPKFLVEEACCSALQRHGGLTWWPAGEMLGFLAGACSFWSVSVLVVVVHSSTNWRENVQEVFVHKLH